MSHETFKLTSLCHIAIRAEIYESQSHAVLFRKGQYGMDTDTLQLQVSGWTVTSSLQLLRLQACQGRDVKERVAESTQD